MTNAPQEYVTVPSLVEAWQITPTNLKEVAKWCNGTVKGESITFPKIRDKSKVLGNAQDNKHYATVGQYVVRVKQGFNLSTAKDFEARHRPTNRRHAQETQN